MTHLQKMIEEESRTSRLLFKLKAEYFTAYSLDGFHKIPIDAECKDSFYMQRNWRLWHPITWIVFVWMFLAMIYFVIFKQGLFSFKDSLVYVLSFFLNPDKELV
jgi:hypothetical protein